MEPLADTIGLRVVRLCLGVVNIFHSQSAKPTLGVYCLAERSARSYLCLYQNDSKYASCEFDDFGVETHIL